MEAMYVVEYHSEQGGCCVGIYTSLSRAEQAISAMILVYHQNLIHILGSDLTNEKTCRLENGDYTIKKMIPDEFNGL